MRPWANEHSPYAESRACLPSTIFSQYFSFYMRLAHSTKCEDWDAECRCILDQVGGANASPKNSSREGVLDWLLSFRGQIEKRTGMTKPRY